MMAETVEGSEQEQDPSASVRGNAETRTKPTGHDETVLRGIERES